MLNFISFGAILKKLHNFIQNYANFVYKLQKRTTSQTLLDSNSKYFNL